MFASKYFLVSANEWRNPSIRLLRQDHVIIKLGPCLVNQSQWLCWGRALWRTTADKICSIVICRGVKINGLLIICWNSIKFVTGFFMMYIAHRADGWQSFIFTLLLCNISSKKTIENFKNTQWYTNNLALKICLLWFIRSILRYWIKNNIFHYIYMFISFISVLHQFTCTRDVLTMNNRINASIAIDAWGFTSRWGGLFIYQNVYRDT